METTQPRQRQPQCPHCGASAFCLGRDCGGGTSYHDYFLLWCTACGYVAGSTERGGDTASESWFNACPHCGAADDTHGDTPPDDVAKLASETRDGVLRPGNPEMKAPSCPHCGALMMCRSSQERVYEEDRFYDYYEAGCPNCGYAAADYESTSTDNAVYEPCPFCGCTKFGEHYGNVKGIWPDVQYPKKHAGVLCEGDPAKKRLTETAVTT